MDQGIHAVTGAFGYSGKYLATRLLAEGRKVMALTSSVNRANPFGDQIRAFPFNFDQPDRLIDALKGVTVLYNTYWVRFNHRTFTFRDAIRNTKTLFRAAKEAAVERIVHISITNPSEDSPFEYFSGKALVERALKESGISYAILRPAVLFGKEDILINNIAWVLRHFPIFGVFGDGQYRLQPIYVLDLAGLMVEYGKTRQDVVLHAIGPETFTYRDLVTTIGQIIAKKRPVISVPPALGYAAGWLLGKWVRDVLITRDEIAGLMAGLLHVSSPPVGTTRLTDWARQHADTLGLRYTSELARRTDRLSEYRSN